MRGMMTTTVVPKAAASRVGRGRHPRGASCASPRRYRLGETDMSEELRFERDELDKLQRIANEARDKLIDLVQVEFATNPAEALDLILGLLFASGFTNDVEQQYDLALVVNQILDRTTHPKINWRLTAVTGPGSWPGSSQNGRTD